MENLYQDIILDHNRRPRNYGLPGNPTNRARARNPLCGDELEIALSLEGERIGEICFQGQGCAISRASASLMTEATKGLSRSEAAALARKVVEGLDGPGEAAVFAGQGELEALSGVQQFPARVKCATLAWQALLSALGDGRPVSTEE
ncbi:MAG: SUF system NifU family Fe-S cluster assembly protein [Oceanipulchritudo sp.]